MANIYEWLEYTEPIFYAPVWTSYEPMDGMSYAEDPMDTMIPLDTGGNGNMPSTWDTSIDPSLNTTMNVSAPAIPNQSTATALEDLVTINNQILICITQLLETSRRPAVPNESAAEPMFTAEELEALEPIPEDEPEPARPSIINGLCVNANPQAAEIECIIDSKRIRPGRQTFFLAKTTRSSYYWFHSPHIDRDHPFRELIAEFRRKFCDKDSQRKTGSVRELRSGRMIEM
jgi:hypothetical protein